MLGNISYFLDDTLYFYIFPLSGLSKTVSRFAFWVSGKENLPFVNKKHLKRCSPIAHPLLL